jgi:hypothetical protein
MLWIFGDSFSTQWEGMGELGVKYSEWKGYTPKIFSNYLSTMLSTDVTQCGIGGADNYTIFDSIIANIPNMTAGDIAIIGWSHPSRFRLEIDNKWISVRNIQSELELYKFVDMKTLQQIGVNRMSRLYWDEIIGWSTLLTTLFHLKGIRVIFWSPFALRADIHLKKQLVPKDWYIGTLLERLRDETAGVIDDTHFSEAGHKELADIIYEKILSK